MNKSLLNKFDKMKSEDKINYRLKLIFSTICDFIPLILAYISLCFAVAFRNDLLSFILFFIIAMVFFIAGVKSSYSTNSELEEFILEKTK